MLMGRNAVSSACFHHFVGDIYSPLCVCVCVCVCELSTLALRCVCVGHFELMPAVAVNINKQLANREDIRNGAFAPSAHLFALVCFDVSRGGAKKERGCPAFIPLMCIHTYIHTYLYLYLSISLSIYSPSQKAWTEKRNKRVRACWRRRKKRLLSA
jgi:hypothetical protein